MSRPVSDPVCRFFDETERLFDDWWTSVVTEVDPVLENLDLAEWQRGLHVVLQQRIGDLQAEQDQRFAEKKRRRAWLDGQQCRGIVVSTPATDADTDDTSDENSLGTHPEQDNKGESVHDADKSPEATEVFSREASEERLAKRTKAMLLAEQEDEDMACQHACTLCNFPLRYCQCPAGSVDEDA